MALSAVRHLAPKLVEGLSSQTLEVKLECMDILNDTLKRFGSQLKEDESDRCLGALFVELGSPRPASRKARRASNLPLLRAPSLPTETRGGGAWPLRAQGRKPSQASSPVWATEIS